MLDEAQEDDGEEPSPLLMLKMKKMPNSSDLLSLTRDKGTEDYESSEIEIATRLLNKVEVVYKFKTYIDGNFQEWAMRRPMFISK
jgi:hypothetical protein